MSHPPHRPYQTGITLAVTVIGVLVLVTAAGAALYLVLSSPGRSGGQTEGVVAGQTHDQADDEPAQEKTEAGARAAAQTAFDTYTSGGYAGFWDLWSAEAQDTISRDDYVRLFQLCKPIAEGLRFDIRTVTLQDDIATVQANRLIGSFTFRFAYQDGRWRYVLDDETRAKYQSKSVEEMATDNRTAGACRQ